MTIHRLLAGFLLIVSLPVVAQKQFGLGVYSGAGLRARTDLNRDYSARYGWESGLCMQFRRKGGKTFHEWASGLNGHYLTFTTPPQSEPPGYYRYQVRMYGLDLLYRFNLRLLHRDRLDLYFGAGLNTMFIVSYRDTWGFHEEGVGITKVKAWGSQGHNEEALLGANCGLSVQYVLNDRVRLSGELNTRGNMEFSLTSATRYTAQNLRVGLTYLFGVRESKKNKTTYLE